MSPISTRPPDPADIQHLAQQYETARPGPQQAGPLPPSPADLSPSAGPPEPTPGLPLVETLRVFPASERSGLVAERPHVEGTLGLLAAAALDGETDAALCALLDSRIPRERPWQAEDLKTWLTNGRLLGLTRKRRPGSGDKRTWRRVYRPGRELLSRESWSELCRRFRGTAPAVETGGAERGATHGPRHEVVFIFDCCQAELVLPTRRSRPAGCDDCRHWFGRATGRIGSDVSAAEECLTLALAEMLRAFYELPGALYTAAFGSRSGAAWPLVGKAPSLLSPPGLAPAGKDAAGNGGAAEPASNRLEECRRRMLEALTARRGDPSEERHDELLDRLQALAKALKAQNAEGRISPEEFRARWNQMAARLERHDFRPSAILQWVPPQVVHVSPADPKDQSSTAPFELTLDPGAALRVMGLGGQLPEGTRERLGQLPIVIETSLSERKYEAGLQQLVERIATYGKTDLEIAADLGLNPDAVRMAAGRQRLRLRTQGETPGPSTPPPQVPQTKRKKGREQQAPLPIPQQEILDDIERRLAQYGRNEPLEAAPRPAVWTLPPIFPRTPPPAARTQAERTSISAAVLLSQSGAGPDARRLARREQSGAAARAGNRRFRQSVDEVFRGTWRQSVDDADARLIRRMNHVLRSLERGDPASGAPEALALRIAQHPVLRAILDASLLTGEPPVEVAAAFDLPPAAVEAYADYFHAASCPSDALGGIPALDDPSDLLASYLGTIARDETPEGLHCALAHLAALAPDEIPTRPHPALSPELFLEFDFRWAKYRLGTDEVPLGRLQTLYARFTRLSQHVPRQPVLPGPDRPGSPGPSVGRRGRRARAAGEAKPDSVAASPEAAARQDAHVDDVQSGLPENEPRGFPR